MAHPRLRLSAAALLVGASLGACAPAAPIVAPSEAAAPAPPADLSGPSITFVSKRFGLRLPLPDGAGWAIDDRAETWLVASHRESSSTLLVRAWREGDNVTAEQCEAQARLWRALPDVRNADMEIIEQREVLLLGSLQTRVATAVVPFPPPLPLRGVITAFGGWAHRCFAYAFVTESTAETREDVVAARLAAMVERSLLAITQESALLPAIAR